MIAVQQNVLHSFLQRHDEAAWRRVLSRLVPSVHPADQTAVQIWFSFWPLKLSRSLRQSGDPVLKAKQMLLDGKYRLDEQIDSSVQFLFGSAYWPEVKTTLLSQAQNYGSVDGLELEKVIRDLAEAAAATTSAPVSVLLGISAVACMILQQVGMAAFAIVARNLSNKLSMNWSVEDVLKSRRDKAKRGLLSFLKSADRRYLITYDERRKQCTFEALRGQDLSMACAAERKDYRPGDHRCIEGPIPCQCRSGACGYCWIGVLDGREHLSAITDFERRRLSYFGYTSSNGNEDPHPHIRLACQAKCYGTVSIVVPPWNGVLNGRQEPEEPALLDKH
jgi:ferredoxin